MPVSKNVRKDGAECVENDVFCLFPSQWNVLKTDLKQNLSVFKDGEELLFSFWTGWQEKGMECVIYIDNGSQERGIQ